MKRSPESSPGRPQQKKIKPSPDTEISQNDTRDDGGGWTKVEKRKAKKAKKHEVKLDVRRACLSKTSY